MIDPIMNTTSCHKPKLSTLVAHLSLQL